MEQRLNTLMRRHQMLDQALRGEIRRPYKDSLTIQRLKRMKLRVKDEAALLSGALRTIRAPDMPAQRLT